MHLETLLLALGTVLLLGVWLSYRWQRRATGPRPYPPTLSTYPSITVIRPIRGLDTGERENIGAGLNHGYPGDVQTIFVFDDDSEPAVPLVRAAIAELEASGEPDSASVLFCGSPPADRTGKLNAMIAGLRQARGELVAFVDSDVRQGPDALRVLVETLLSTDGAGAAFAPVAATSPTQTVGDAGYVLMLNGMYAPAAAATARAHGGELPFIMGQFMVFKREAIAAIGGLETAEGQLVDDMYLGIRLTQEGYHNVISPLPVDIIQQGSSIRDFAATMVRWIAFSRSGLPALSFKLVSWLIGAAFWLGLIVAVIAAAHGLVLAAVVAGLVPLAVSAAITHLHHAIGGAKLPVRHRWVSLALLLVSPLIYLVIFTRHEVVWRGRRYPLNTHSKLA